MRQTIFPRTSLTILFIYVIASCCMAQSGNAGYVCARCGQYQRNHSDMIAHTCARHGLNCPKSRPYQPIVTKTPEQIRQEREKQDLKEAAEDANDWGVEYYEKGDWQTAINYFRASLEYDPDFDDAKYNLRKAEQKLNEEMQKYEEQRKKEEEKVVRKVELPEAIHKYMLEADQIIVPPPGWESMIQAQVDQLKLDANSKHLMLAGDLFMAAFDEVTTLEKAGAIKFKLLVIGGKSLIASQNEAEIFVFRQTAAYERVLKLLKDKNQSPLLLAAIRAKREKKAFPAGTPEGIISLVNAAFGEKKEATTSRIVMDAMLSSEAKAAFLQTAKYELLSLVSDEFKEKAAFGISERLAAMKSVNDKITLGRSLASTETDADLKTTIMSKISDLQAKMTIKLPVPEAIRDLVSLFGSGNLK